MKNHIEGRTHVWNKDDFKTKIAEIENEIKSSHIVSKIKEKVDLIAGEISQDGYMKDKKVDELTQSLLSDIKQHQSSDPLKSADLSFKDEPVSDKMRSYLDELKFYNREVANNEKRLD